MWGGEDGMGFGVLGVDERGGNLNVKTVKVKLDVVR